MQPATVQQLGRRERGKLDKRRRIREATRDVFRRKGYEDATTREIADLADVAIGTLFAYAADKRELLMMVVNDDRESFPDVEQNIVDGPKEVLQLLMSFFTPRYRYWAKEPELSRAVVQETVAYHLTKEPGPELARFYAGRQVMIDNLAQFFEREQRRGQIVKTAPPQAIAWLFMTIYQGEVRQWLQAERPSASDGLKRLRQSFALALSGVRSPC
ncbi:MAG TPA: TetR/AcrR family transcriptional regulator [Stellaceae bacterium]|jgi:AcrR family transcriptional regulator|nr:TetR/AcrR family transcriptional regulator [Stellaceae bacterium]